MIIFFLFSLVVIIFQSLLTTSFAIQGIYPDFCLIFACLVGFLFGEYKGLAVGLTVGFLQDLLAPGGIGVNMVLKGSAGALGGFITHTISTVTGQAVLVGMWVLSISCGWASMVIALPEVNATTLGYFLTTTLIPQSLYNSLLALGGFLIVRQFYRPGGENIAESQYRH